MRPDPQQDLAELDFVISEIRNSGGYVPELKVDNAGNLECLFVSTASMVRDLAHYQPHVVQLDTTFSTNRELYKLLKLVYCCSKTGKTRVAAFAFMVNEVASTVQFALESFREMCPYVSGKLYFP